MDACTVELLFNEPEEIALAALKQPWTGQRMVSVPQIRAANARVLGRTLIKRLVI
ncbi:hypothetical protein [Brucella intermedia]|uniref:hypothetical protein n=1 Tax=Brucella intermedia TaxID=94625 RepID=UPI003CE542AE